MNTYQITQTALEGYMKEKLSEKRINFLLAQANEQIDEITQNKELYEEFLEEVNAPEKVDKIILWMLFMSDEYIVFDYIKAFDKDLKKTIPISDLSDLLFYVIHLKKVKEITLDGFDYLMEYEEDGIEEVDQFSFTNAFLYIQKLKEVQIDF
ncbi:MAG: hypothetical protein L3J43_07975 [Sulfurovum sp.]|nr:hypothetical protein [Sulfurovum sp.]